MFSRFKSEFWCQRNENTIQTFHGSFLAFPIRSNCFQRLVPLTFHVTSVGQLKELFCCESGIIILVIVIYIIIILIINILIPGVIGAVLIVCGTVLADESWHLTQFVRFVCFRIVSGHFCFEAEL